MTEHDDLPYRGSQEAPVAVRAIPYIGFSNTTLAKLPRLAVGDLIDCPHCSGQHEVEGPDDWVPGDSQPVMAFLRCGEKSYLAGVRGKSTIGVKVDASGSI